MSLRTAILEGITPGQVRKLIKFSNQDPQILKYTRDAKRFKSLIAFKKWSSGKHIYTLTGGKNELYGIIWFSRKLNAKAKDCQFTFAIRIYPPARGKGQAKSFMKQTFKLFGKQGVWLSTLKKNRVAIGLYQDFGFKVVASSAKRLVLTFSDRVSGGGLS